MTSYLDELDLRALGITLEDVSRVLRAAFERRGRGEVELPSKLAVSSDGGGFFHAMPVVYGDLAVVKWVACGEQPSNGYLSVHLLATDAVSGRLIAVIDFGWLTAIRTAVVTALAAEKLAAPHASSLAILGSGQQARAHVDTLRAIRPLREVIIVGRTRGSVLEFANEVTQTGLAVTVFDDVNARFYEADLVLSAVSRGCAPVLDARRLRPGALMVAIDLAYSWRETGLSALDVLVTDDIAHARGMGDELGPVRSLRFATDLPTQLCADEPLAWDGTRRMGFVPPGVALADAALAALVLHRAGLWESRL